MNRLLLLIFAFASSASAQITVDGTLTDAGYRLLSTDANGAATAFGAENDLNALYVANGDGVLNIGVAASLGRNNSEANRIYGIVFMDTRPGGVISGDFDKSGLQSGGNGLGKFNTGTTFDYGFTADYALQFGCYDSGCYSFVTELRSPQDGDPATVFGETDASTAVGTGEFRSFIDAGNRNNREKGFEFVLNTTGPNQAIEVSQNGLQFFVLLMKGDGEVSNQFLSPAQIGAGNFGLVPINFRDAVPDPVALVTQTLSDNTGYRLLSTPVDGVSVGNLAALNLVQGILAGDNNSQAQYPLATPNLFTSYTSSGYSRPQSTGFGILPGRGFFWQFYDRDITPDATSYGGGTSRSYVIPERVLIASGKVVATQTSANTTIRRGFVAGGNATGSNFYMIGNPFAHALAASAITETSGIGRQTTLQAWKPTGTSATGSLAGTYVSIEAGSALDALAVWQGVFAEVASPDAPTFGFDAAAAIPTPQTLVGRPTTGLRVALSLSGTTATGAETRDEAAIVRLLPDALDGWDADDASKLTPPAGPYALLAPVTTRDGAAYRTAVTSLPEGAHTVPLAFLATDAGTYTLTWDATLAAGSLATLRDLATGAVVDLETQDRYTFSSAAADWAERFELVLSPRGATATEEGATTDGLRVLAPRPNPARGLSEVAVELGAPQHVRADLFDALGRRVVRVYDAAAPAGPLALRLDVSGLAPGVYVLRVVGATVTATRTVTVAR